MRSGEAIALGAPKFSVHAGEGEVTVSKLSFLGTILGARIERFELFAELVTTVVQHARETVARSFRSITELDQLRAGAIDYVAERNVAIRGANALVTAQELVKMDAEQVHIG